MVIVARDPEIRRGAVPGRPDGPVEGVVRHVTFRGAA